MQRYDLQLRVRDSGGKMASQDFAVQVQRRKASAPMSHEFEMTLNEDYDKFMVYHRNRIDVALKIAEFYGDADLRHITVTRIQPGSVVFAWTNNSLPVTSCRVLALLPSVSASVRLKGAPSQGRGAVSAALANRWRRH